MYGHTEVILQAHKVSKLYARKPQVARTRIARMLGRVMLMGSHALSEPTHGDFWAVRDVAFEVRRGEALGIIGLNGSGKTTLLRMLAGQILPDRGEINVVGRTASMIDLTAGFSMATSGRANIYLRGAALGRTRAEMSALADEIIAFSELGEAIDAPVSTYSSGMTMRLAFSIMVASTPDILFIDEVLAVGDFLFRQKCLAKLREIRERCSIVMVSHSMNDIRRFCDRVLVMHLGMVKFSGKPDEAIEYFQSVEDENQSAKPVAASRAEQPLVNRDDLIANIVTMFVPESVDGTVILEPGQCLTLFLRFEIKYKPVRLIVGVPIFSLEGEMITGFSTDRSTILRNADAGSCSLKLSVSRLGLNPGVYQPVLSVVDGVEFLYRRQLPTLRVRAQPVPSWGIYTPEHDWMLS